MSEGGKLEGWPHLAENILSSYVFCPQTSHVIHVFNAQLLCASFGGLDEIYTYIM